MPARLKHPARISALEERADFLERKANYYLAEAEAKRALAERLRQEDVEAQQP